MKSGYTIAAFLTMILLGVSLGAAANDFAEYGGGTADQDSSSDYELMPSELGLEDETASDRNDDGTSESDFQSSPDRNDDGTSEGDFQDGGTEDETAPDQNEHGSSESNFQDETDQNEDDSSNDDFSDEGTDGSDSDGTDGSGDGTDGSDDGASDGADGSDGSGDGSTGGGGTDGGSGTPGDGSDGGDTGDGDGNDDPTVTFSFSPSNPRVNQEVTFTASASDDDGTIEEINWDLDDDGRFDDASGETARRSFSSAGSYKVTVEAVDNDGAENTISDTVNVRRRSTGGGSDDDDDSDGSGDGSIDDPDVVIGGPEPSMTASISTTSVNYGEQVTVSGRLDNVESPRDVEVLFGGERVGSANTAGSFSMAFVADRVGSNTVRIVSGDLERSFSLQVNPTVNIEGINTQNFLRHGERHQVCVELESGSTTEVTLYRDGESQGTRTTTEVACFTQFAPEEGNRVNYRAIARAGSATDVEEKTVSLIANEQQSTPTGGFFSKPSNIALTVAGIIAAALSALAYFKKAEIAAFVSGLRA